MLLGAVLGRRWTRPFPICDSWRTSTGGSRRSARIWSRRACASCSGRRPSATRRTSPAPRRGRCASPSSRDGRGWTTRFSHGWRRRRSRAGPFPTRWTCSRSWAASTPGRWRTRQRRAGSGPTATARSWTTWQPRSPGVRLPATAPVTSIPPGRLCSPLSPTRSRRPDPAVLRAHRGLAGSTAFAAAGYAQFVDPCCSRQWGAECGSGPTAVLLFDSPTDAGIRRPAPPLPRVAANRVYVELAGEQPAEPDGRCRAPRTSCPRGGWPSTLPSWPRAARRAVLRLQVDRQAGRMMRPSCWAASRFPPGSTTTRTSPGVSFTTEYSRPRPAANLEQPSAASPISTSSCPTRPAAGSRRAASDVPRADPDDRRRDGGRRGVERAAGRGGGSSATGMDGELPGARTRGRGGASVNDREPHSSSGRTMRKITPFGSVISAQRPTVGTSNGGMRTAPPSDVAFSAAASASATWK